MENSHQGRTYSGYKLQIKSSQVMQRSINSRVLQMAIRWVAQMQKRWREEAKTQLICCLISPNARQLMWRIELTKQALEFQMEVADPSRSPQFQIKVMHSLARPYLTSILQSSSRPRSLLSNSDHLMLSRMLSLNFLTSVT